MAARLSRFRDRAPIRLLWLIDSLAAGGAEALTVRFVRALEGWNRSVDEPALQVAVTVAFLKRLGGNPYEEELRSAGIEPVFVDARHLRDLRAFRRLLRLVRQREIEVIHSHLAYASIWGALAGRRTGLPVASSLHVAPSGDPAWSREGIRRWLRARLLAHPGVQPVAVSRAVARAWELRTAIPTGRIRVIPNGVDVGELPARKGDPRAVGLPSGDPLILAVAVLRRGKGLDLLVEAAPGVLAEYPEARFAILGDGPERSALTEQIAARGLGDRVRLLGFRHDVPGLLAAADLFVLPSREDAFPTVLLEAAAAGLPAVAADVGGVSEIVVPGETGLLVPPENAGALTAALLELAGDPARRRRLGERAHRHARAELSAERWLERLVGLYTELCPAAAQSPRPARASAGAGSGPPRRGGSARSEASSAPLRWTLVEPVGRGGLIHHAFQLGRALTREGMDVTLVTSRRHELDELRRLGVEIPFRVEALLRLWDPKPDSPRVAGGWLRRWRRLVRGAIWYREQWRLLRYLTRGAGGSQSDVVLFGDLRFVGDLVPLALLARWCRRRRRSHPESGRPALVDLCHNVRPLSLGGRTAGRFERVGGLTGSAFRRIYRLFDRILVHFESNRGRFLALYDLPPERVGTIPLGHGGLFGELEPGTTSATLRRRLGIAAEAPVVLLFGSLAPYKGPDLLVEAFARVHERFPDARLVLAGPVLPGCDLRGLHDRIDRLGLRDAVHVETGYVPTAEVASWMGLATVAVFPYRDVSQSAVVALALTSGVASVVTRVGAMEDMVHDGATGRVVAPEDPRELAEAIVGLLADAEERERMGRAAQRFAREELSWRRVARELLREVRPLVEPAIAAGEESQARLGKGSVEGSVEGSAERLATKPVTKPVKNPAEVPR